MKITDVMIDDFMDEPEYDECPQDVWRVVHCYECNHETVGEQCGFCGTDLCPHCFSAGGGFCSAKHTQEQIDEYEDNLYPPSNEEERQQRMKQRKARDELKSLGILP